MKISEQPATVSSAPARCSRRPSKITRLRQRRGPLAGLALVAFALLLAGCGAGGGSSHSILLYNGQHPQVTTELVAAFEKQTGIQVRVHTNDGIVLADQLLQEGSSSPADVYLTENSPELVTIDEHGLFTKLAPSTLAQVPAQYSAASGSWVGIARRISALAYNSSKIAPGALPKSVLELADPQWKGKIAIAPTDSDFPPLVGAVIAAYGKPAAIKWLAGLKRNAVLYQDDESVVAAVNRGDIATGVINHYYWYRLRLELGKQKMHSAVYFFPNHDVGSIENISGAGVLKSSSHQAQAQAFVRFLVSPKAQEILSHGYDFEYPTRPGVSPNAQLTPLTAIEPATLGPNALGNDQPAAQLIEEAGLA
jgi:iron(III) transport system substrate-binding protein